MKERKQKFKFPWMYYDNAIEKNIDKNKHSTIKSLFRTAYKDFSITNKHLGTRRREFIEVNATLAFVIREQYRSLSLQSIGNLFGKNHATIIHYIEVYENILCGLAQYRKLHEKLTAMVMLDMYGIDQQISGKSKAWLKSECLRLSGENKELKTAIENIKTYINA